MLCEVVLVIGAYLGKKQYGYFSQSFHKVVDKVADIM